LHAPNYDIVPELDTQFLLEGLLHIYRGEDSKSLFFEGIFYPGDRIFIGDTQNGAEGIFLYFP